MGWGDSLSAAYQPERSRWDTFISSELLRIPALLLSSHMPGYPSLFPCTQLTFLFRVQDHPKQNSAFLKTHCHDRKRIINCDSRSLPSMHILLTPIPTPAVIIFILWQRRFSRCIPQVSFEFSILVREKIRLRIPRSRALLAFGKFPFRICVSDLTCFDSSTHRMRLAIYFHNRCISLPDFTIMRVHTHFSATNR